MKRTAITLLGLLLASPVFASELHFSGRHSARGPFTSTIRLDTQGRGLEVVRTVTWARGKVEEHRGRGTWLRSVLRARLSPKGGLTGALARRRQSKVRLVMRKEDGVWVSRCKDAQGDSVAREVEAPPKPETKTKPKLVGRILALHRREAKLALERGVAPSGELRLADFVHLGIKTGVRLLRPEDQSRDQRTARSACSTPHAWVETLIEGGIRLPFQATVSLGYAQVSLGLEHGAELRYRVVDLVPIPPKLGKGGAKTLVKSLAAIGRQAFGLPLTAREAREHNLGSVRELSGEMTVAVRGDLGIGFEVGQIAGGVIHVGAQARVGGFYRLRGHMQLVMTRLPGSEVRLRLRRGRTHTIGKEGRVFLGATLDRQKVPFQPKEDYLQTGVELASAGADLALRHALKFELKRSRTFSRGRELDISYRFDLDVPSAAQAYERAMKGDFTRACDLRRQAGSGVVREHRVLALERETFRSDRLQISVLLNARDSRRIETTDLWIDDENGRTRYEVFRYDRQRQVNLVGKRWERELSLELVRADDPSSVKQDPTRWFRFRYTILDPRTRRREVDLLRRLLKAWRLPVDLETKDKRIGATNTFLAVDLSDVGIAKVLSASPQQMHYAYVRAFVALRGQKTALRPLQVRKAKLFVERLSGLRSRSKQARARYFKRLTTATPWDLYTISAIVNLAPRDTIRLEASVMGRRLEADALHEGRAFDPSRPDLKGH